MTDGEVQPAKVAHRSMTPGRDVQGVPEKSRVRAQSLARKAQYGRNKDARKGEADRHVSVAKPKHLFSGKRGIGSNDRR
jgi:nucleolar GTP-binding protein